MQNTNQSPKIVQYLQILGEDYTRLFLSDIGLKYVVKFHRVKHYRKREVVNEFIAGKLAALLNLPVAPVHVISLSPELCSKVPQIKGSRMQGNVHLAIPYNEKAQPFKQIEDKIRSFSIKNQQQLARMIAFDFWIVNMDRSRTNLLISCITENEISIQMIDHGKCFPGDYLWDKETLKLTPEHRYNMPIYKWALSHIPNENELYESAHEIKLQEENIIKEILDDIPKEWEVTKVEKEALLSFLMNQQHDLEEYMSSFLSYHKYV